MTEQKTIIVYICDFCGIEGTRKDEFETMHDRNQNEHHICESCWGYVMQELDLRAGR